jgi:sulfite reductase beta subunit-like hemoprotein
MLGGNREGTRLARTWRESVLLDEIPVAVGELFKHAQQRKSGQAFGDWVNEAAVWPAPTTQA